MNKFILNLILLHLSLIATANTIMTVDGPIDSANLGRALVHEHVLADFIGADETGYHRWDRNEVTKALMPHLKQLQTMGFDALFECTPAYLGRDPALLKMLSDETGLHFITNTGYYGALDNKFIPKSHQAYSIEELSNRWIKEFEEGIEGTGIRPGFIKIGVGHQVPLTALHEKLVRAACRTHLRTGLTIVCHTGPTQAIFEMSRILEEEGVSMEAFIWVHATQATSQDQIKAAKLGLWVSIDHVTDEPERIRKIVADLSALKMHNLLHRVHLSHDAGWYNPGEPNGGEFRPYTAISMSLIPKLREASFTQEDLDQLFIHNPKIAFSIEPKPILKKPLGELPFQKN